MLIQTPGIIKDKFRGFSKEELNTTNAKMEKQQQHLLHIKRLLSTAATGTGIVGDLDAASTGSRKGERNLWRLEEIKEMLTIMQETNALDLLNDKTIKSETIFYDIEKMMIRRGYNKKTHNQIWTKWKFLKSTFMTSRRNGIIPKMIPGEIYLILHKMLANGSESNYKAEDSSNAASLDGEHSLADEENNSSSISNSNGKGKKNSNSSAAVKPEAFGMAHPIFGFRLGLVKSEPVDTGYETTANNSVVSENDSLENSAAYPIEISPQNSQDNSVHKPEINERVTDSPEVVEPTSDMMRCSNSPETETESSLLIPRETASMSIRPIRPIAVKQKVTPHRASNTPSALRIAPFAKEANIKNSIPQNDCTPPRLRTTEVASSNSGSMFSVSPAISLPSEATRGSIVRLPRDVTLQLRTNYTSQNNPLYPSKVMPSSNASYTLRTDERFPNRQRNTSPTHQLSHQQHNLQQEQPMTSQMAKLRAGILNKKRRLEIPNWDSSESQAPPKVARFSAPHNVHSSSNNFNNAYQVHQARHNTAENNDNNDDEEDYEDEEGSYGVDQSYNTSASFQRFKPYEQKYMSASTQKPKSFPTAVPPTTKPTKNHTPMEEILKDMAMSLRQSQLQMVNDFFEQQMDLARKEHEFQMEQDRLIMVAFKKQTQQLMKVAQDLFGSKSNEHSNMNVGNKSSEQRPTNLITRNKHKNGDKQNSSNTRDFHNQAVSQHYDLSSNDSDELEENGDSDPLLSAFDPTQFVSSELVELNNDNEDEDSSV